MKRPLGRILQRLEAAALAAGTLWLVGVTAGSDTAAEAADALVSSAPLRALRWELGDLWTRDTLSAAAALTIGEAPLLLAARPAVAELWSREEEAPPADETGDIVEPVEETPLEAPEAPDNGVPARTLVPTGTAGYTVCGRTYISNSTDYTLAVQDLQQPFSAVLTGEGPQVLILHTHGSEGYTRYNVVRVGDEIARVLGEAGISVLHDRTLYDYPSYNEAYDRSLAAVQTYLAQYPSIQFVLDVHRDAIEDAEGNQYKVVSAVEEGTAAQMTLVVGSDGSGLSHPNWMDNLRLAVALQEETLREYPTLMRPMLLRNSRYNQHVAPGALLLEVGAAGNAPEEAVLAGQLFAQCMAEVLQARSK